MVSNSHASPLCGKRKVLVCVMPHTIPARLSRGNLQWTAVNERALLTDRASVLQQPKIG